MKKKKRISGLTLYKVLFSLQGKHFPYAFKYLTANFSLELTDKRLKESNYYQYLSLKIIKSWKKKQFKKSTIIMKNLVSTY